MKKRISPFFLTLLFLTVAVTIFFYLHSLSRTEAQPYFLYYDEHTEHGWEMTVLRDGIETTASPTEALYGSDTMVLRRTVEKDWAAYARISVDNARMVCIFVDDTLIHSNAPAEIRTVQELPDAEYETGTPYTKVISLDPAWVGKTLTIVTRNYTNLPWVSISFDLTADWVIRYQTISETYAHAVPGAIFAVLTLLLLGLFLYQISDRSYLKALPLLLLALSALLQMLSYLTWPNNTSVFFTYQPVIEALYPLLPLLYLSTKMNRYRKAFLLATVPLGLLYVGAVASWSIFFLPVPYWIDKFNYLSLVLVGLMAVFSVLCSKAGNPFFHRFQQLLTLFAATILLFTAASFFASRTIYDTVLVYLREAISGYPRPMVFLIFTGVLLILFYQALEDLVESRVQMAQDLETLRLHRKLTAQSLESAKRTNEALAVSRHDQLHHLRAIAALCRKDPEQAASYISELTKEIEAIPVMRFTENPLINAILSVQAQKAATLGIHFTAKAMVPDKLPLSDKDLSTVLMNLSDNALEAAAKTTAACSPRVDIQLEVEEDALLISIENSLPEHFDTEAFRSHLFQTTKQDKNKHGYGIRSARAVVKQYGGELTYHMGRDTITVNTAMCYPHHEPNEPHLTIPD